MKVMRVIAGLAVAGGMVAGAAWPDRVWGASATPAGRGAATRGASVPTTAAAELYSQIVAKYAGSQWETIGDDLGKSKDIAGMTKEQQADVTYIRQAVNDGRPAWWNQVKQGRKMQVGARLWQRAVTLVWDPSLDPGIINMQTSGGQLTFTTSWPASDMDSAVQAEHGFTKGDLAYVQIWGAFEMAEIYSSLSVQRLNTLDQPQKVKLNRFMAFRGTVTAAYFGTPRAQRWAGFLSLDAYLASHLTNDGFIPRKPFGAMLVQEIVSHPSKYPSLRIPRNVNADNAEGAFATNFMNQFERTTLTFAEYKGLREAVKEFALANDTKIYESGKVVLPNKLGMALNPDEDTEMAKLRNKWLMEELAQPGVHAAAATASKPAATRGR